jgi:hypothetical protein
MRHHILTDIPTANWQREISATNHAGWSGVVADLSRDLNGLDS